MSKSKAYTLEFPCCKWTCLFIGVYTIRSSKSILKLDLQRTTKAIIQKMKHEKKKQIANTDKGYEGGPAMTWIYFSEDTLTLHLTSLMVSRKIFELEGLSANISKK